MAYQLFWDARTRSTPKGWNICGRICVCISLALPRIDAQSIINSHMQKKNCVDVGHVFFQKTKRSFANFLQKKPSDFPQGNSKRRCKTIRFPRATFAKIIFQEAHAQKVKHQIQSSNPSPTLWSTSMALKKNRKGESMEFGYLRVFETWGSWNAKS